jgi:hypothetical protein
VIVRRRADTWGHVDVGAAFRYVFPLDGGSPEPGGLVTLGGRWRRWLALAGAGVENASVATAGAGQLTLRRIPLRAGAGYELPAGRGAFRFELGLLVALWTASTSGIAHPDTATVADPGMYAAVGYRFAITRHVEAFAAIDFEYAFVSESLVVTGTGAVGATPTLWLAPQVGLAGDFL